MQALGYPLNVPDRIPEITEARNIELGLGLQVSFLCTSFGLLFFFFQSVDQSCFTILMHSYQFSSSDLLDFVNVLVEAFTNRYNIYNFIAII